MSMIRDKGAFLSSTLTVETLQEAENKLAELGYTRQRMPDGTAISVEGLERALKLSKKFIFDLS